MRMVVPGCPMASIKRREEGGRGGEGRVRDLIELLGAGGARGEVGDRQSGVGWATSATSCSMFCMCLYPLCVSCQCVPFWCV